MIKKSQFARLSAGDRVKAITTISLTLIILATFLATALRSQAQSNAFCWDWTGNFGSVWTIEIGTSGGMYSTSYWRSGDFASVARATYAPGLGKLTAMWMHIFSAVPSNNEPVRITYTLSKDNNVVYENTFYLYPSASDTYWSADPRISLPNVEADFIRVDILQATDHVGEPAQPWYYQVNRLCGEQLVPTPTKTPTAAATNTPNYTATSGGTLTPYPTRTATITKTPTRTRTPVPTWTRTPTFTATATSTITDTPTGTITPVTPTDTLSPTPWVYIPPTLEPTDVPMQSTLAEYSYSSPQPPSGECTDVGDPCYLWPDLNLPDLNLTTPTAVAMLPTLTPLPTTSPWVLDSSGTPVIIMVQEVNRLATAISSINGVNTTMNLVDAEGTPVMVAQQFYQAGGEIGGFIAVIRGVLPQDIGPAGGLLLFILAMVLLNIQIRLILFLLPIIIKIIEFIANIVGALLKLLLLIGLAIVLLSAPNRALAQSPTPTATVTPLPTWTVTPTLYTPGPSATSKYGGLRATPTALSITPYAMVYFDLDEGTGQIADNVINFYRLFNSSNLLDMVSFVGLLILCVIFLARSLNRLTKDTQ